MTDEQLKSAAGQAYLAELGFYQSDIDGDWGPQSRSAARAWLSRKGIQILARVTPGNRGILNGIPSNETLRTLAAQIGVACWKYYSGPIDGVWGPKSIAAVRNWNNPGNDNKRGTPYEVAKHYIGIKEIPGKQHNGVILNWYRRLLVAVYEDETAWCSTFVNFCALEAGFERTGKLNARSWLGIGEHITTQDAREGDVIVFERGDSGWQGHVTFLVSIDRHRGTARCLGGNQSDEVNISNYALSKLLGVRRLRSLDQLQGSTNKI